MFNSICGMQRYQDLKPNPVLGISTMYGDGGDYFRLLKTCWIRKGHSGARRRLEQGSDKCEEEGRSVLWGGNLIGGSALWIQSPVPGFICLHESTWTIYQLTITDTCPIRPMVAVGCYSGASILMFFDLKKISSGQKSPGRCTGLLVHLPMLVHWDLVSIGAAHLSCY